MRWNFPQWLPTQGRYTLLPTNLEPRSSSKRLLPLGAAAMWAANVSRFALLVGVGIWISPTLAVQGFHSQVGWLAINGIALRLVLASRRVRFFIRSDPSAEEAESTNPTAAYLVPVLAVVAATMITGAFTARFDQFYPLRVLAAAAALWYFRRYYAAMRWTWSWTAVVIGAVTFVLWMALEPTRTDSRAETSFDSSLNSLGADWSTSGCCSEWSARWSLCRSPRSLRSAGT
jgi:hypothetical protein